MQWSIEDRWFGRNVTVFVNHNTEFNTESEPSDRIKLSDNSSTFFCLCACAELTPQVNSIAVSLDC